jgi:hypothetical protein
VGNVNLGTVRPLEYDTPPDVPVPLDVDTLSPLDVPVLTSVSSLYSAPNASIGTKLTMRAATRSGAMIFLITVFMKVTP